MPDSFFCFCAFLHKSIRLTIPIANLLQFAVTLQFRLQTSCNLQQPCKPLCKPPAICSNLANPFADLLQFVATLQTPLQTSLQMAATLQTPLQTSCNLWQPCKPLCRPSAICGNLANPFADLLYPQKAPSRQRKEALKSFTLRSSQKGARFE